MQEQKHRVTVNMALRHECELKAARRMIRSGGSSAEETLDRACRGLFAAMRKTCEPKGESTPAAQPERRIIMEIPWGRADREMIGVR